jgi:deoxyribonuclease-4
MKIGAHMSIAGGVEKCFERGAKLRCETIQIFTANQVQWRVKDISTDAATKFRAAQRDFGIAPVFAHNSYLVNLCSTDEKILKKSIRAMILELRRCEKLQLPFVVMHPGAHLGGGERAGLRQISRSLDEIFAKTARSTVKIALETTAGQGSNLGFRFEHLAEIIASARQKRRLCVCVDTCHIFAAGYDIRTRRGFRETMREFDRVIGIERIAAFHLNDSKAPLGSRVDRHAHIGRGQIGLEAFKFLVNDERFCGFPGVLETPHDRFLRADLRNLRTLRALRRRR